MNELLSAGLVLEGMVIIYLFVKHLPKNYVKCDDLDRYLPSWKVHNIVNYEEWNYESK